MITVGIDLGIRKAAYAVWDHEEMLITTGAREVRPQHRAAELTVISEWVLDVVYPISKREYEIVNVFIEEPLIGNNRKYSLNVAMTYGAVLAELGWLQNEGSIAIYGVNVAHWKRGTVGVGNASKEQIKNYIHEIHSSYPALCGNDQDRIDAACIGLYGCRVSARADGLFTQGGAK